MRARLSLAVVLGLALGFAASYVPSSDAARNSSGTYSLPSGNPVVAGTTITASNENTFRNDVAAELTLSLDRNGRGAMLAPLQLSSGTSSAPSLTFSADTDTGLYRAGAADVRLQVDASQMQKWSTAGSELASSLTLTGHLVCTAAASNTAGITTTGNGTGAGISATGGATAGSGGSFTGGTGGRGVTATGAGTGDGILGTGGATSGAGVVGVGGAPNGIGVYGDGTGTGVGGWFIAGTAATASARTDAVLLSNGDLSFVGTANPNSDVAIANRLTPKNLVKLWGRLDANVSACTVDDGFNIASCSIADDNTVSVTVQSDFANANYGVLLTVSTNQIGALRRPVCTAVNRAVGSFDVECTYLDGTEVTGLTTAVALNINVIAIGAQ